MTRKLTNAELNLLGAKIARAVQIYNDTRDCEAARPILECGLCIFATYDEMESAAKRAGVDLAEFEEMLFAIS